MAKTPTYIESDVWFVLRVSSRFRDQIQDRLARESVATYNPVQRIYRAKSKVAKAKGEKRLHVSAPVFSTSLFVRARPSGFLVNLFAGWVHAQLLPARHIEGADGKPILIRAKDFNDFRRSMRKAKYGERNPHPDLIGVDRRYQYGERTKIGEEAFEYPHDRKNGKSVGVPDTPIADMETGREFGPGCVVESRPGLGPAGTRMTVDRFEQYHDGWYAIGRMEMLGTELTTRAKVRGLRYAS